ncbi:polyketide synthase, partial [Burkholderia sp. Ac-20379]|nr:polyketide synthase [Burkholderia sp. Ac-20379]
MVQISRFFGVSIAPTTFFEARHLNDLAQILRSRYGAAIAAHYAADAVGASVESDSANAANAAAPVAAPASTPTPTPTPTPTSVRHPAQAAQWLARHRRAAARVAGAAPAPAQLQAAPAPAFAAQPAAQPVAQSATPSATQPAAQPVAQPAAPLAAQSVAQPAAPSAPQPAAQPAAPSAAQPAAPAPQPASSPSSAHAPVAVIAMDGRFARSPDLDALAEHLRRGDDCIEEVPADRWDWRAVHGDPKQGAFTDVKYGGFVTGHDRFDAAFFNISPKEAELMDPQHRLFIECVWRLIERAGYAPGSLSGRKVGIFLGINLQDYATLANQSGQMDAVQLTGLGHVFCPNRLSFLLDVHGPSQVIDTACSSSLVAIHRAVMSIRHEGCEMAIAGGANLMLSPLQHIMFSQVGMICPDGRCKTFSRDANGYVRAEGIGAVLLKRLDLAERDGDTILGVIRGSAENHGGAATSLTAPNPRAQAQLIVEAHRQAEIDPRSVTLIECHGTGTALGDPIELDGLKSAFDTLYRDRGLTDDDRQAAPRCGLGSVKSNIGHAETAAGVAGLIKVLLAMRDGVRYRSLHCEQPNPLLDFAGSPFELLQEASPWTRPVLDGVELPRRAGLSSFGAGGANAHLVIEEYRPRAEADAAAASAALQPAGPFVVPLSAKNDAALREAAARLLAFLQHGAPLDAMQLRDLAHTLQSGRDAMRFRLACTVMDHAGLLRQLSAFVAGETPAAGGAVSGVVERTRGVRAAPIDPLS